MIDTTNLEEKLLTLSGEDHQRAELAERNAGNTARVIALSSGFHARLAAQALNVLPDEIKSLPVNDYNILVMRVADFLFTPSDVIKTLYKKSEESAST